MFLYYVLAQRLASKLPTALQLSLEEFMFFSENDCCVMKKWNIGYRSNKPIWALSDSNEHIIIPHPEFFLDHFYAFKRHLQSKLDGKNGINNMVAFDIA